MDGQEHTCLPVRSHLISLANQDIYFAVDCRFESSSVSSQTEHKQWAPGQIPSVAWELAFASDDQVTLFLIDACAVLMQACARRGKIGMKVLLDISMNDPNFTMLR